MAGTDRAAERAAEEIVEGTPPAGDPTPPREAAAQGEPDPQARPAPRVGHPWLATLLAWLWPGLGHVYLRRWGRGLAFCALVLVLVIAGTGLEGRLWQLQGNPLGGWDGALAGLLSAVSLGMGLPYVALVLGDYGGDVAARGYEYGTAFLLTAALMNLLLIFDARDVALGRKP